MHLRPRTRPSLAIAGLLVAGLLAVPPVSLATAQPGNETGDWFVTDAPDQGGATSDLAAGVTRFRSVSFDAEAAVRSVVSVSSLALARAGERVDVPAEGDLSLTLFDGQKLSIEVSKVALMLDVDSRSDRPHIEVQGRQLVDGAVMASAAFAFTVTASGSYELGGSIERGPQPTVEVQQTRPTVARLAELSESSGRDEGDDVAPLPLDPATDGTASDLPAETPPTADAVAIVDLLVGYVSSLGPQTEGTIRARVAETNRALTESRAQVQLNILGVTPVAFTPHATDMSYDLDDLRKGARGLSALTAQRDAIGADLVSLIVPVSKGSTAGIAWIPSRQGVESMGFSVTALTAFGGHSFTHELGHNLGANHDYNNSDKSNRPFDFSYGHRVDRVASSVVAYANCPNSCPRSLQFSNPNVPFIGHPSVPSGTAQADNARSISLMGPVIAAYRNRTPVSRIAGADRFQTAAAISRHGYPNSTTVDTVLVATGMTFPDALSAAPLAAKLGGPLLLTGTSELPVATAAEIARLKPSKVIVVGGPSVVDDTVIAGLKQLIPTGTVQRVWGADRYETSLAVVRTGWSTTENAFLATGDGFADALSAGAAAGVRNAPVILVPGTWDTLHAPAAAYLASAKVKNVYIAGATAVVSPGIEADLRAKKYAVTRHGGTDRFSTSTLIAKAHHTVGGSMYLATAHTFPDALAGAAVAGKNKAPLILSAQGCVLTDIQNVQLTIKPSQVILLGGITGLSEEVAQGRPCT